MAGLSEIAACSLGPAMIPAGRLSAPLGAPGGTNS